MTRESLWAHSPAEDSDRWHPLEDHLRATAELARRFATPFGGGELAYWLGALHDIGKASCTWQEGLAKAAKHGGRVGTDHKALGTRIAYERGLGPFSVGIFGHHGGLIDLPSLRISLRKRLQDDPDAIASAESMLPRLLPDLPADLTGAVPEQWLCDPLVGEMAMRLCFSALVDADWLDTSAHFAGLAEPQVRDDADFGQLFKRFEQRRRQLLAERSAAPVDAIRARVYDECLAAAEQRPGIFRLPAPTGAGKTLAAAGFALRHAELHDLRRVIVAVPFLTITEQNAAVYRQLLDEDGAEPTVLEHHSQVNFEAGPTGRWARLAAENWDAPFVVTTFVRLFESLFDRKPGAMRRIHRLARSVIVLDEVQALRHAMLPPILDALRVLVQHFGATVVLSSATQPDFWALREFEGVDAVDLIADAPKLVSDLRRVRYEWWTDPAPSLADVAERAASERAAMVVVNTTENAKTIFNCWRDTVPEGVAWHLSTRMCPAHRKRVLETVRRRLRAQEPVLLVSTQLIEAGVDIDFPVVFRAMAPADSLLQAAGRANRDGRLPEGGRVVVFTATDGGQPPGYGILVDTAKLHLGPRRSDPDDLDALSAYYRDVYRALNLEDRKNLGQAIQESRRRWEFQTVAEGPVVDVIEKHMDAAENHAPKAYQRDRKKAFRLIDDEGIPVVTPQGAATPEEREALVTLIDEIRTSPVPKMSDLRRLQPYTTTIHPSALKRGAAALMRPIIGDSVRTLAEWCGEYDPYTGITIDPGLEDFVL